jgi:peptidoglycan-N-acetylglucosamine deacetylase
MTRRDFLATQALTAASFCGTRHVSGSETPQPSSVAITMDDFNIGQAWPNTAAEVNRQLLNLFDTYGVRITMFVAARNVDDEHNRELLEDWSSAGHVIANHTYSHFVIDSPPHSLAEFQEDVLKAERVLTGIKNYQRLFRFPALKEGNTVESRDGMRAFLDAHGYRNGYVTIDASDRYYAERLASKLRADRTFATERFRGPYVDHIRDRSQYYDGLARNVLGRSPRHTLLVHYSYLNAHFLGAVLEMYKQMGWRLVNSDDAFADPVFRSRPKILPAGESLIWALAKESGRYEGQLRYPGEDGAYEKARLDALGL